ncbi:phage holin family protein [Bizionia argentinensis JUB59]|uniref:Phage holin family protein n=1 Tax=Bizionia argentinensis JUB59 TaxID=1046627 RepID=G2EFW8_9FLAO|nr:phage holin family protein [Bizionia argentinensis]EGV42680.1 phage holin family protein [Bizionia argentinensis JUB59]
MKLIIKLLLTALAVVLLAEILPGIQVASYTTAILVAIVLALLNLIVRPILIFLTLPATIITLGLFLFVINACIILLAGNLIAGFAVSSFWTALFFSILLTILQSIFYSILGEDKA